MLTVSEIRISFLDEIGLDELEFEVSDLALQRVMANDPIRIVSPWVHGAMRQDVILPGKRSAQLLGSYVGQNLIDVANTISEMSLGLDDMGMSGTRAANLSELGAFALRYPRASEKGLIFCATRYRRVVNTSSFDASSAISRYGYGYLGYAGGHPYIAMWDPKNPIPAFARILVIEG